MRRVLIVGASSAIAEAAAREFARRGDSLFLVARSEAKLAAIALDLKVRGASKIAVQVMDARHTETINQLTAKVVAELGGIDMALLAHGVLSNQIDCQNSSEALSDDLNVNALSIMQLCTDLANHFEEQRSGMLAVISSVAGDRGRASNYVYGASKAALTAFTSGLRQRLYRTGVKVLTIKPGFVDSPMTAGFKKGVLWASSAAVGKTIAGAMLRGRCTTIYVPFFWWPIMGIIRSIPEFIFRRLKL